MMLDFLGKIFQAERLSVDEELVRRSAQPMALSTALSVSKTGRLLLTSEILECYGKPDDPSNLTTIVPPYPFKIAWDPTDIAEKITCHKKIALPLMNVFNDLLAHYGAARIIELGIDLFGGLYNLRPQRKLEKKYEAAIAAKNYQLAYTYLSRHAWAIAIDLDPARNQLKQTSRTAQFAKSEYKAMIDIFYKHGFIGYGRERNNDWMHFEIGLLIN